MIMCFPDLNVWITHYSLKSWMAPETWDTYLVDVERLFGDRLIRLDANDPVRRKADTKAGEGRFVVEFGEHEASRWVRGKFDKTKIEFEVQNYKSGTDSFGRLRENSITFFVPQRISFGPDIERLLQLFALTNRRFGSFYAYADFKETICSRKPSTPSLDLSRELLGVFWLTYFGPAYCNYFGDKLSGGLALAQSDPDGGVALQLGPTPAQVEAGARESMQQQLGASTFAAGGPTKERGQFALTLQQIAGALRNDLRKI